MPQVFEQSLFLFLTGGRTREQRSSLFWPDGDREKCVRLKKFPPRSLADLSLANRKGRKKASQTEKKTLSRPRLSEKRPNNGTNKIGRPALKFARFALPSPLYFSFCFQNPGKTADALGTKLAYFRAYFSTNTKFTNFALLVVVAKVQKFILSFPLFRFKQKIRYVVSGDYIPTNHIILF